MSDEVAAAGELDLAEFAEEIGTEGPVTIAGLATRGGPVDGVRPVMAPGGIVSFTPDEMTIRCGAGTPMETLDEELARARPRRGRLWFSEPERHEVELPDGAGRRILLAFPGEG